MNDGNTITFFFIVYTFIHSSFSLSSTFSLFIFLLYPPVRLFFLRVDAFFISLVLFLLLHLIFAPSPGFLREEERRSTHTTSNDDSLKQGRKRIFNICAWEWKKRDRQAKRRGEKIGAKMRAFFLFFFFTLSLFSPLFLLCSGFSEKS